ncbi:fungal transcriptional regulatory protein [Purpureocillium lavendulum]|uniref:Fungal transcriptional regulatory protein n=1 Tax=Purpureocillium lavendulum TaxID=1247861 RepID=A0AB34G4R7_9HYPO|nr:fungal transcriptional regulatory protein [Purpureocillium lavendulum]
MIPEDMAQSALAYKSSAMARDPWNPARSAGFVEPYGNGAFGNSLYLPSSANYAGGHYQSAGAPRTAARPAYTSYQRPKSSSWEAQGRYSPTGSLEDFITSPSLSDYSLENGMNMTSPGGKSKGNGKRNSQRRPSNRDEFDGPHQFLQRPSQEVIAMQERELPHLPTNLHVQEQDSVLNQVNDRLSQCAFDFVAKYQFPIPLTQDMRPVERPQDREWTEWVYLLKRLATKRRIPARVLYNGQIKQFVTILENSLEMRHAAKHQSRPLKDDRNILQLISAGIQVAKILKDASAMDYLDRLYVDTEKRIQERASSRFRS